MPPRYELTMLTAERELYQGRVESLVAPGAEGYFGVLARHAPMIAELTTGELSVVDEEGSRRFFAVSGGFLEVEWDQVTILADAAEPADEINMLRARQAQERAQRRLRSRDPNVDLARAEAALRRALNRLRIAEKREQRRS